MTSPAVVIEVCIALIKRYLADYQGCPRSEAGWSRFAEALQLNAVSVEHAEAILQAFDEGFPTVRQIHDVAVNLLPRFETKPDERAEWEKKYGKPEAFKLYPPDEMACHWQAFRDILYYTEGPAKDMKSETYWENRKFKAAQDHPQSMEFVRRQVAHYGWPAIMQMPAAPEPMPYRTPDRYRNPRSFVPIASRITQADVDRAKEKRKSTPEVDRELDGWDDPDR